jgi:hypothetical protein
VAGCRECDFVPSGFGVTELVVSLDATCSSASAMVLQGMCVASGLLCMVAGAGIILRCVVTTQKRSETQNPALLHLC